MPDAALIHAPLWFLPLLVLAPWIVLAGAIAAMRRLLHRRSAPEQEPDWSVPPLADGTGSSLFHRWDVRCKIVTLLIYSFGVTSLTHLKPALAAIAISLAALLCSRPDFTRVLTRILAIAGFLGMLLLVMPFSAPAREGDTIVIFGGLAWSAFNLRGLNVAATIAAKALAVVLVMEPLLGTAPLPTTLHGLCRLGAPRIMAQMVLLSYRYLQVFRLEAQRMGTGMQVRGFRKRTDMVTLRAVANFLGMLFVRSFERTERVFDAMRARGYRGEFPQPAQLRLRPRDLLLAAGWLISGAALLLFDRLTF